MPDTTTQEPAATNAKSRPGATVAVASKMPNGLILRLFRMEPFREPVLGGGYRESERAVQTGDEYTLHGTAFSIEQAKLGNFPRHQTAGGFSITTGIPRDYWDEWLRQNEKSDMVRNGLIFAYDSEQRTRDAAAERDKVRSGLEPLDPDNPPPDVRRVRRDTNPSSGNSDADNL